VSQLHLPAELLGPGGAHKAQLLCLLALALGILDRSQGGGGLGLALLFGLSCSR